MAFHRHTGKVAVLPGVVGVHLVNGEEGFAKSLLCQRNNFECRLKRQQSAAVTPGGKWLITSGRLVLEHSAGGLVCFVKCIGF